MTQEQRRLFAEKLMDTANIAVGALVFGQILSPVRISASLGYRWCLDLRHLGRVSLCTDTPEEKEGVTVDYLGLYVLLGGIVLVAFILTLPAIIEDWRESRHQP